jgi:cytochrome b6-f complex iron-sulfur subunit
MTTAAVIGVVIVVLLAILGIAAGSRRRELGSATGELSRETLKRDRARRKDDAVDGATPGLKGRELEVATIAERSKALVPAGSASPTVWIPPDAEALGVSRRQFLNRAVITLLGLSVLSFAAASFTAFLWPIGSGGFGSKLRVGKIADLIQEIEKNGNFLYKPEGRMWLVQYPDTALPKARVAYKGLSCLPGMEKGIVALYQKCVHLGCRVPSCATSQWFECPCHGSQYNRVGEKKGGPAPRGLDRFGTEISADGVLTVNTGDVVQGPPIGTNTTGQEAEGPHCV